MPPRSAAGLYHTAVLFDSRSALAAAVYSVATRYPTSFTGSSDHLVSLAFYFDDPEGNGVELYWDRPRAGWQWDGASVRMGTLPLDPNAFLQQHLPGRRPPARARGGRPRAPQGRRHRDRARVLRRRARLRGHGAVRRAGAVRLGGRLPPPRRDEHLGEPRRRARARRRSGSARSRCGCRTPTRSVRSATASASPASRCRTTGASSSSPTRGATPSARHSLRLRRGREQRAEIGRLGRVPVIVVEVMPKAELLDPQGKAVAGCAAATRASPPSTASASASGSSCTSTVR